MKITLKDGSILLVLVSILVWVFAWSRLHIEKKEGVVLLALYAAYLVYICVRQMAVTVHTSSVTGNDYIP